MDYVAGLDEIFRIIAENVTAPIIWPNTPQKSGQYESQSRAIVAAYTTDDRQVSFRRSDSKRRFRISGTLIVEFLAPMSDPLAFESVRLQAESLRNVFRRPNVNQEIWFRNARIAEMPSDRMCNRVSVVTRYEYDNLR